MSGLDQIYVSWLSSCWPCCLVWPLGRISGTSPTTPPMTRRRSFYERSNLFLGGWGRVSGRHRCGPNACDRGAARSDICVAVCRSSGRSGIARRHGSRWSSQEDRSPAEPATDPAVEASSADLPKSEDTLATGPSPSSESSAEPTATIIERWPYFSPVKLPAFDKAQTICDFLVTPPIFDKARSDLGDLRLFDAAGREVPYALRIRQPVVVDQLVAASEFNRVELPSGSTEVTLDLGENPPEQNSLDVVLPGTNFRARPSWKGATTTSNGKRSLKEQVWFVLSRAAGNSMKGGSAIRRAATDISGCTSIAIRRSMPRRLKSAR